MENEEMKIVCITILLALALLFGAILLSEYRRNECIALVKDKSSSEIAVVCKP